MKGVTVITQILPALSRWAVRFISKIRPQKTWDIAGQELGVIINQVNFVMECQEGQTGATTPIIT